MSGFKEATPIPIMIIASEEMTESTVNDIESYAPSLQPETGQPDCVEVKVLLGISLPSPASSAKKSLLGADLQPFNGMPPPKCIT
jgi:hypothetical protein